MTCSVRGLQRALPWQQSTWCLHEHTRQAVMQVQELEGEGCSAIVLHWIVVNSQHEQQVAAATVPMRLSYHCNGETAAWASQRQA
mmetsp:Transcript_48386/g.112145  ORF Transcript_48386/g.112145 Transcript_48386/m.112145 type:complete len:85 (-) Transcript_48386:14-268(-)